MKMRFKFLLVLMVLAILGAGVVAVKVARDTRQMREAQRAYAASCADSLQRVAALTEKAVTVEAQPAARVATVSSATLARMAGPAPAPMGRPHAPQVVVLCQALGALKYNSPPVGFLDCWPVTEGVKDGEYDPQGGLTLAKRLALEKSLPKKLSGYLSYREPNPGGQAGGEKKDPAQALRQNFMEMDRLEAILLNAEWLVPRFEDYERYYGYQSFSAVRLHQLAVLRAMRQNDPEKAECLLLKGIEAWQRLYLYAFPEGDQFLSGLPQLIFMLGEMPEFPTHGLEEAAKLLGTMQLTAQQRADLRTAHALRWIRSGGLGVSFKNNTLHFISVRGLSLDRVAAKILDPTLRMLKQEFAIAWASGDEKGMDRVYEQFKKTGFWANLNPDTASLSLMDIENSYAGPDQALDLSRLFLAAALYRRANGRYPEAMAELTAKYLDPPLDPQSPNPWMLMRLAGFESMAKSGMAITRVARPVFYRVSAYDRLDGIVEGNGSVQEFPRTGRKWNPYAQSLLRSGFKSIPIQRIDATCPLLPEECQPLLERLGVGDRVGDRVTSETMHVTGDAKKIKNLSNQTTAPALKK